MLKIRLQRIGRKHEPVFRLVLTDSKNSTKSGKFLEILGNYDARRGEKAVINTEKVTYWMSKGAQVSDTVHNMLVSGKVIEGKKINNLPLKKAIVKEVPVEKAKAPTPASAPAPMAEEAPVEVVVAETPAEAPAPVVEATPEVEVVAEAPAVEAPAEVVSPDVAKTPTEETVA